MFFFSEGVRKTYQEKELEFSNKVCVFALKQHTRSAICREPFFSPSRDILRDISRAAKNSGEVNGKNVERGRTRNKKERRARENNVEERRGRKIHEGRDDDARRMMQVSAKDVGLENESAAVRRRGTGAIDDESSKRERRPAHPTTATTTTTRKMRTLAASTERL